MIKEVGATGRLAEAQAETIRFEAAAVERSHRDQNAGRTQGTSQGWDQGRSRGRARMGGGGMNGGLSEWDVGGGPEAIWAAREKQKLADSVVELEEELQETVGTLGGFSRRFGLNV